AFWIMGVAFLLMLLMLPFLLLLPTPNQPQKLLLRFATKSLNCSGPQRNPQFQKAPPKNLSWSRTDSCDTAQIQALWLHGKYFDRTLDQLLAAAKHRHGKSKLGYAALLSNRDLTLTRHALVPFRRLLVGMR